MTGIISAIIGLSIFLVGRHLVDRSIKDRERKSFIETYAPSTEDVRDYEQFNRNAYSLAGYSIKKQFSKIHTKEA